MLATRWHSKPAVSPFTALEEMTRDLVGRVFDDLETSVSALEANGPARFRLPTDVVETVDDLRVYVDAPGMTLEDFDVRLENGRLRVSGQRRSPLAQDGGEGHDRFWLQERPYGRFGRSFTLPRGVDWDHAEASYDRGVLTVVLPKTEEAKPRRIRVGGGKKRLFAGKAD